MEKADKRISDPTNITGAFERLGGDINDSKVSIASSEKRGQEPFGNLAIPEGTSLSNLSPIYKGLGSMGTLGTS
jgi:hypothetical protein